MPPLDLADSCPLGTSEGRVTYYGQGEYSHTHNVFYEILVKVATHELEGARPLGNWSEISSPDSNVSTIWAHSRMMHYRWLSVIILLSCGLDHFHLITWMGLLPLLQLIHYPPHLRRWDEPFEHFGLRSRLEDILHTSSVSPFGRR